MTPEAKAELTMWAVWTIASLSVFVAILAGIFRETIAPKITTATRAVASRINRRRRARYDADIKWAQAQADALVYLEQAAEVDAMAQEVIHRVKNTRRALELVAIGAAVGVLWVASRKGGTR